MCQHIINDFDNWSFIENGLGNSIDANNVFSSVLKTFESLLEVNMNQIGTVIIKYSPEGPMAISKKRPENRNIVSDFIILLKPAIIGDWRNTIYQVSHEINHVILECDPYPSRTQFYWIYEMLSQLAVLIITKEIGTNINDVDLKINQGDLIRYHKESILDGILNIDIKY